MSTKRTTFPGLADTGIYRATPTGIESVTFGYILGFLFADSEREFLP